MCCTVENCCLSAMQKAHNFVVELDWFQGILDCLEVRKLEVHVVLYAPQVDYYQSSEPDSAIPIPSLLMLDVVQCGRTSVHAQQSHHLFLVPPGW